MLSGGYRLGDFTPTITYSKYGEHNPGKGVQRDRGVAITARYDINNNSDFKIQFDRFWDKSSDGYPFVGNADALTVAYDIVF